MAKEWSPITGETPNANDIMCKDCKYRDKTEIEVAGKVIKVGVTRDSCDIYHLPEYNGKPKDVLFQSAYCPSYEGEE